MESLDRDKYRCLSSLPMVSSFSFSFSYPSSSSFSSSFSSYPTSCRIDMAAASTEKERKQIKAVFEQVATYHFSYTSSLASKPPPLHLLPYTSSPTPPPLHPLL